jgi:hypothetical protein
MDRKPWDCVNCQTTFKLVFVPELPDVAAYTDNETNYCAQCQTGGKVLADRSLSRLLEKIGHEHWI